MWHVIQRQLTLLVHPVCTTNLKGTQMAEAKFCSTQQKLTMLRSFSQQASFNSKFEHALGQFEHRTGKF